MNEEDPGSLLRRHGLRSTPQRRAILQAFRGRADEHLSADEVLARAGRHVPDISRGTVYATLAELTELNILAAVGHPEPVRYETNLVDHDHFACRLCLRLVDIDLGGEELRARPLPGFTVEAIAVRAEGVCGECDAYRRGLIDGAARVRHTPLIAAATLETCAGQTVASPIGELGLVASAEGIVHLAFDDHADFAAIAERAGSRRGPAEARRRLRDLSANLERYFAGAREPLADTVDWQLSTEGHAEVLSGLRGIGYGERVSYDRIAGRLAAYDCGVCFGTNPVPLVTPCHRVSRGQTPVEWWVGGTPNLHVVRALEAAT